MKILPAYCDCYSILVLYPNPANHGTSDQLSQYHFPIYTADNNRVFLIESICILINQDHQVFSVTLPHLQAHLLFHHSHQAALLLPGHSTFQQEGNIQII